jgi:K+/H+ antiporter YhaU regulatory subunit KhtT
MLNAMLKPHTLQLLVKFLDASVSETHLEEIRIPEDSHLVGKSLQESGIRQETGVYVMGYYCCDKVQVESNPPPNTIFKGGDVIVGLGTRDGFIKLDAYTRIAK